MSETNDPFAAFKQGALPTEGAPGTAENPAKKKARKKAAGKARSTNGNVDVVPPVPSSASVATNETRSRSTGKKTRKARKARSLKLDPMIVFEAAVGLDLESVSVIAAIIEKIQGFPKKSRGRIVAALAKIFA